MKAVTFSSVWAALLALALRAPAEDVEWRAVRDVQPAQAISPRAVSQPVTFPITAPGISIPLPPELRTPPSLPAIRFEASDSAPNQEPPLAGSSERLPNLIKPQFISEPVRLPGTVLSQKNFVSAPSGNCPSGCDTLPTYDLVNAHPLCNAKAADSPPRWSFSAEALLWWIKDLNAPPLLTTATPPNNGFIGGPTTQILIGNGPVLNTFGPGGRFSAGVWFDCDQKTGMDASFFFLGPRSTILSASSQDFPVLIRPFFANNPQINGEFGEIVAFPPGFAVGNTPIPSSTGSFTSTATSLLLGVEIDFKHKRCIPCADGASLHMDPFLGFRFLDLSEALTLVEQITVIANNPNPFDIPGTRVLVTDAFATQNQFYGGQVGANMEFRNGNWFAGLRGSIALGVTHETLSITGSQVHTQPGGAVQTFNGGLLALPGANIGQFSQDHLSFVPEVRLNVGYQITPYLRTFVGYNFLYWYSVIRPGTEIDRVIDATRIPNPPPGLTPVFPPRPMPLFNQVDFFAHGVNAGFELRW